MMAHEPLSAPDLAGTLPPSTYIDEEQRLIDAFELLDLMSPVNDPKPKEEGAMRENAPQVKRVREADTSASSGGGVVEDAIESPAMSTLVSDVSVGAPNEPTAAELLQVLDVLGAPPNSNPEGTSGTRSGLLMAAGDGSMDMSDDAELSVAELEAVLDLLGAPPNPNPMLEQMVLQGGREAGPPPPPLICQPVRQPAAPPSTPPKSAAQPCSTAQPPESAGMDCPD